MRNRPGLGGTSRNLAEAQSKRNEALLRFRDARNRWLSGSNSRLMGAEIVKNDVARELSAFREAQNEVLNMAERNLAEVRADLEHRNQRINDLAQNLSVHPRRNQRSDAAGSQKIDPRDRQKLENAIEREIAGRPSETVAEAEVELARRDLATPIDELRLVSVAQPVRVDVNVASL